MLSIKAIGGSNNEVAYYAGLGKAENHDYYSEDGTRPGQWWGAGAKALGLEGNVNPIEFKNLLNGLSTDGSKQWVQKRSGKKLVRRAGFDLTYSVPKSFSTVWSLATSAQKAELDKLAEQSLHKALEVVQNLCGVTRRGKNGAVTENAKLVAAIFSHDTARGITGEVPDANRHFHAVVANVVVREDGTTGAWDARPLFQRRMKMALGALFRAELSKRLHVDLGIATYRPVRERTTELASWFEISGVPSELMQAMSKRRQEIERWLRKHQLTGAKAAEKAALLTRNKKEKQTWHELNTAWQKLGQAHGYNRKSVQDLFANRLINEATSPEQESHAVVKQATAELIQHQARFTENELIERTAIEAQTRGIGIDDVLAAVERCLRQSSEIVQLETSKGVRTFTTRAMLALEKRLLETAQNLHQQNSHAVAWSITQKVLSEHKTLRPEQQEAVRQITTGSDLVSITGIAGSGKTFMLAVARKALEQAGFHVLGTALASKAAQGLEEGAGIRSQHIHKLLHEFDTKRLGIHEKSVLVVDEAGMVGTMQMERLLRIVVQAKAKLILVGDHKQLQAIDAGAPFRKISDEVGTTELNEIIRQQAGWARNVVRDLRDGRAEHALSELFERGQLFIEPEREEAIERLVLDWQELVLQGENNLKETMVFAGMNVDVRELNRRIQDVMTAQGQLGEYAIELDGMHIHLGDRVKITKNSNLLHLRNGSTGEVTGVTDQTISVLLDEGIEVDIDTREFNHLTLGYAISLHSGQGMTCEHALILTGDVMTDRESSYVSGSRARGKTLFYTDQLSVGDWEGLAAKMNVSRQNEMAIEHQLEIV